MWQSSVYFRRNTTDESTSNHEMIIIQFKTHRIKLPNFQLIKQDSTAQRCVCDEPI